MRYKSKNNFYFILYNYFHVNYVYVRVIETLKN